MSVANATSPVNPPSILAIDPASTIGPIFIGNVLNWMLMGTLIVQVYTYYRRFAEDRIGIRILVYSLLYLDITQTIFLTHHGWWFIIRIWGKPDEFDFVPWSAEMIPFMCGLIAGIVQIFYAWRISTLSTNKIIYAIATLIVMTALAQSLSAIISAALLLVSSTQSTLLRLHPGFSVWLAGSFATDILITACMTWILYIAKAQTYWAKSETLVSRLIQNTIQTGSVTLICACVDLILFLKFTQTNYHMVPAYILGKLYTNSLMVNLNARRPRLKSLPTSTGQSDSFPMQFYASQQTQRTGDHSKGGVNTWPNPTLSEVHHDSRNTLVVDAESGDTRQRAKRVHVVDVPAIGTTDSFSVKESNEEKKDDHLV